MKNKNVLVISNFHEESDISRTNSAYKYFLNKGCNVAVLYSNYSHSLKKFRYFENKDFISIRTISYSKSLSIKRILSYTIFALGVLRFLIQRRFDYIYLNLPPNILTVPIFLCKRKSKVILDIIDLWPESITEDTPGYKRIPIAAIGSLSKALRGYAIKSSEYCLTESHLFYSKLNLIEHKCSRVIELSKIESSQLLGVQPTEILSIGYLGNIGDIYDFKSLLIILKNLSAHRPVHLHIIGLGPNAMWLFEQLNILKISHTYHGASFDEGFKKDILSKCWFGYNGYKDSTEVALSYKSIDYLSFGVPLLNSAKDDSKRLIEVEKVGYNFDSKELESLVAILVEMTLEEITLMKTAAYLAFKKLFSDKSYGRGMDILLTEQNSHEL